MAESLTKDLSKLSKSIGDSVQSMISGKPKEEDVEESKSIQESEPVEEQTVQSQPKKTLSKFGETLNPKIFITPKKKSLKESVKDDEENLLKKLYQDIDKSSDKKKSFNEFLDKKELMNREELISNKDYQFLYPSLDDPNFNIKIAERKEFYDTKTNIQIKDVKEEADKICNIVPELNPHQQFVRNFLSFSTPYNSLLLYHGLGTGKTCAAISVAEEQRDYLKQLNLNQRIIVVASPNVQENFKLQLFDERKLELIDGLWNIKSCLGNKFVKEINPTNLIGLSKDQVVDFVNRFMPAYFLYLDNLSNGGFFSSSRSVNGRFLQVILDSTRSVSSVV